MFGRLIDAGVNWVLNAIADRIVAQAAVATGRPEAELRAQLLAPPEAVAIEGPKPRKGKG